VPPRIERKKEEEDSDDQDDDDDDDGVVRHLQDVKRVTIMMHCNYQLSYNEHHVWNGLASPASRVPYIL